MGALDGSGSVATSVALRHLKEIIIMFQVEFGIVHRDCLVNEMSRAYPQLRFVCPGGFIVDDSWAEEIIVMDRPGDQDVEMVLAHLQGTSGIDEVELLERTVEKAFIRIVVSKLPKTFCSQAVYRNRCFPIGNELQEGGVEKWTVGCVSREQGEQLLKELTTLGDLTYQSITEVGWQALLDA